MKHAIFSALSLTIIPAIFSLPTSASSAEIQLVFNVAKIGAWLFMAGIAWRMFRLTRQFYDTFNYFMAEHRMVVNVSRDEHPERWGEFDSIIESDKPHNRKPK